MTTTSDRSASDRSTGDAASPGGSRARSAALRLAPYLLPLAVANLVANVLIVLTGGVVRLTASGLGCPTWPRCTSESYVTHPAMGIHGIIEFGNRTLTFVLAAIALLTFIAALGAAHRRATRLAFAIGLYIPAQAVIGGITVLTDLNPWVVSFHFLSSMVIIGLCVLLLDVLRGPARGPAPAGLHRLAWLTLATGAVVLYLGTVVTGSGPHAGDLDARRTGLDPQLMSHVHAAAVYLLLGLTVLVLFLAHRRAAPLVRRAAALLLALEVAQGVVGFVQYFTGLPELLVGIHMLGAALFAAALAWLVLTTRLRRPAADPVPPPRTTATGTGSSGGRAASA